MRVYVLVQSDYQGEWVIDVYADEDDALAEASRLGWRDHHVRSFDVKPATRRDADDMTSTTQGSRYAL